MLTKITHLEKPGGFRLRVRFNDGSEGVHDFAALVNDPVIEPLEDPMMPISHACFSSLAPYLAQWL